jgi:hypothetical protein
MDLVIGEVLGNLAILYVLDSALVIPPWNAKMDNYVVLIFELAKYMARNGFIFLFHDDDFYVLRDISQNIEVLPRQLQL